MCNCPLRILQRNWAVLSPQLCQQVVRLDYFYNFATILVLRTLLGSGKVFYLISLYLDMKKMDLLYQQKQMKGICVACSNMRRPKPIRLALHFVVQHYSLQAPPAT